MGIHMSPRNLQKLRVGQKWAPRSPDIRENSWSQNHLFCRSRSYLRTRNWRLKRCPNQGVADVVRTPIFVEPVSAKAAFLSSRCCAYRYFCQADVVRTTIFLEKSRGTHDSGSRKRWYARFWLEKNSTILVRTTIFEMFWRA